MTNYYIKKTSFQKLIITATQIQTIYYPNQIL